MSADQDEQHSGQLEPDRLNQFAEFPLLDFSLLALLVVGAAPPSGTCDVITIFPWPGFNQGGGKDEKKKSAAKVPTRELSFSTGMDVAGFS